MRTSSLIHKFLTLPFIMMGMVTMLHGQPPTIFLQLEDRLTSKTYRFHIGDEIEIRTKEFPKDWIKSEIADFIREDGIIVFREGYVKIDDILRVRMPKGKWGRVIGTTLMTSGAGMVVYGSLGGLADGNRSNPLANAVIGGIVTGVGWLISRTGRRKKYKIGPHTQLRIYDIGWPDPIPRHRT